MAMSGEDRGEEIKGARDIRRGHGVRGPRGESERAVIRDLVHFFLVGVIGASSFYKARPIWGAIGDKQTKRQGRAEQSDGAGDPGDGRALHRLRQEDPEGRPKPLRGGEGECVAGVGAGGGHRDGGRGDAQEPHRAQDGQARDHRQPRRRGAGARRRAPLGAEAAARPAVRRRLGDAAASLRRPAPGLPVRGEPLGAAAAAGASTLARVARRAGAPLRRGRGSPELLLHPVTDVPAAARALVHSRTHA